jgi:predicted RNase H-like nuclease (RuvC/YqgF family)
MAELPISISSAEKNEERREKLKAQLREKREEFHKKVEERRAELKDENIKDIEARVEGMREEIYALEKKLKKSKTEERANIDREIQELVQVLRIEESAAGIPHKFQNRPKSYYREKRIKRIVLTISIVIVIAMAVSIILH